MVESEGPAVDEARPCAPLMIGSPERRRGVILVSDPERHVEIVFVDGSRLEEFDLDPVPGIVPYPE